ncbi:type II DNA topoisomerase VI subunit [Encephalitozoon cuniculi]|uniref:DNA topoisomerase (ATP-hydrolyzing) n=1 Tax=Encephalitozoon cuniculi TaxID=6035 RepID=M1K881_ENCCN|nr:meiotic recombination protein rec12 [Encephalitozoon cuniculi]UYI27493.1 type II DNA topoisomerase VI subunit [Encephalitozoon cuniculi]
MALAPTSSAISGSLRSSMLKLLMRLKSRTLATRLRLYEIIIEMQELGITRNEREIFYMDVNVFRTQSVVRRLVSSIASELQISKHDLGVRNTLKGIFIGRLGFVRHHGLGMVEMSSKGGCPQLIPDMSDIAEVLCDYKKTVVVEKDTVLQRIASEIEREKCLEEILFVCGKGYPCKNTVLLLKMIEHKTAVAGLFDLDPFGIHIFCIYKYGSKETPDIRVETIMRIGVCMEDVLEKNAYKDVFVRLNVHDLKMINRLVRFGELSADLLFLQKIDGKVEMEALFSKEPRRLRYFLFRMLERISS